MNEKESKVYNIVLLLCGIATVLWFGFGIYHVLVKS